MDEEEFKEKLQKLKPKKKKLTVPAEFLDQAKSYEEKLAAVKVMVDREKSRALLLIKSMLAEDKKTKRK